jgi:hypothetical protein
MRPVTRHHVPAIRPRPQNPAIIRGTVAAVTGAIRRPPAGVPKVANIEPGVNELERQKAEHDKKIKELEKKLADLEKKLLESKDGEDAKKKIAEEEKKKEEKIKAANDEYNKKLDDNKNNACCVWTPEELKAALDKLTNEENDAIQEFEEAKIKIVGEGLEKSDPKKAEEYKKTQSELKNESELKQKTLLKLIEAEKKGHEKQAEADAPIVPPEVEGPGER